MRAAEEKACIAVVVAVAGSAAANIVVVVAVVVETLGIKLIRHAVAFLVQIFASMPKLAHRGGSQLMEC